MRGIGALALAWHLLFSAGPCLASEEISLFAAASLTDALKDVGKLYDAASGNHVVFNFGASSDLARQIVAGAPADVAFEVPREKGPPIVYPLAPIAASKKKDTRALVRYLTGPEAVKVYERYGFLVVGK